MQNLQPKLTRALAISLALIMGLVLAGCGGVAAGKADINLDIDEDLLVSGTYQMGVDLVRLEKEKSIFTSVLSESDDAEGGRVNGNTVTYDLRTYGQNTIVVNAEAPSFPWLLVFIIIGVVLLLIIGAVVIFLLLKKKNAGQS
ncbi:hypothetical protein, partial [Brevibacterium paucivorans]